MDILKAKQQVILAGKALVECGLIVRTWGNVSCRIDKDTFAISPSGRAYDTLTPDDIVVCQIADASYEGTVKPSSEKGIHALVYRTHTDVNFVIHTHQVQASSISTVGIDHMPAKGYAMLGNAVPVSAYGLPSTSKLKNGIGKALEGSDSHAVIMANHGGLCFGVDYDATFKAAKQLEDASFAYIKDTYIKKSGASEYTEKGFHEYVLSLLLGHKEEIQEDTKLYNSKRTKDGFILEGEDETTYTLDATDIPDAIKVHQSIYKDRSDINHIIQSSDHGLLPLSMVNAPLKPLLDDFAQIVGRSARCAKDQSPEAVVKALKGRLGVLVPSAGALCCASNYSDAHAVQLVMEKNALAQMVSKLLDGGHYIGLFDCALMHFIYTQSYAKKAKSQ